MKSKFLFAIIGAAMLGPLPAMAATTTYQYTGPLYSTFIDTSSPPFNFTNVSGGDATVFGNRMTGEVTFNFDTTGVSGTFPYFVGGSISNLQLTSGVFSVPAIPCSSSAPAGCTFDIHGNPIGFGELFVLTNG